MIVVVQRCDCGCWRSSVTWSRTDSVFRRSSQNATTITDSFVLWHSSGDTFPDAGCAWESSSRIGSLGMAGLMDGAYVSVIHDEKRCRIVTDPLGFVPLWMWRGQHSYAFSQSLQELLMWVGFDGFDSIAVSEYLIFGYPLPPRTLFSGFEILPPATILDFRPDSLSPDSFCYSDLGIQALGASGSSWDGSYVYEAWNDSLRKITKDVREPYCVSLSGGLDSRYALGSLARLKGKGSVIAVNYSVQPSAHDAVISRAVAERLGVEYHHWDIGYSAESIEAFVRSTTGLEPPLMSFLTDVADRVAKIGGSVVVAHGGDVVWGSHYNSKVLTSILARYPDAAKLVRGRNARFILGEELGSLVTEIKEYQRFGLCLESVLDEFIRSVDDRVGPMTASLIWSLSNRQRVYTWNSNHLYWAKGVRTLAPTVTPDSIRIALSMPFLARLEGRDYHKSFSKEFSSLASIPITRTRLRPSVKATTQFLYGLILPILKKLSVDRFVEWTSGCSASGSLAHFTQRWLPVAADLMPQTLTGENSAARGLVRFLERAISEAGSISTKISERIACLSCLAGVMEHCRGRGGS